jgi:hypothetical protein
MALTPTLSYVERNDNKLLTFADTTADWGTPLPAAVAIIDLDISITTSNGVETVYETIDLHALHGHATQVDMTWDINASMLLVGTVPMGTSDDELPDGLWKITYTLDSNIGTPVTILIDGRVRVAVYELLRALPTIYNCSECKSKTVLDALYAYGCLNVLRSDAYVAKTEEIISLLYTIERLITNGSNYTW